jgi:outer membrane protein OmpA-like peptidoglycan-associated protein
MFCRILRANLFIEKMHKTPIALTAILLSFLTFSVAAENEHPGKQSSPSINKSDSVIIPLSNANLGTFPYFKTLKNFYANDSATADQNRVYFYSGTSWFPVDGKVSSQNLNVKNSNEPTVSDFGCVSEFDRVVTTLGGVRYYSGKLPEDPLKKLAGADMVELGSKGQLVKHAYEGIVEYVIRTPEKEVWVQLQSHTLPSKFYTLLVVEKLNPLISLNTNKQNQILTDLEKSRKAVVSLNFEPDKANLLTSSKDRILSVLGVFQAHPDWKIKLVVYNASLGKPEITKSLTEKRADAIKTALIELGVKSTSIDAGGMGDSNPIVPNDTEQGRLTNTRMEITLL